MIIMNIRKFFNSKTTLISFIIYVLLTAFIFSQSLSSGTQSSNSSGRVSNLISQTVEFLSGNKITLKDDGKIKALYPESIDVSGLDNELTVGKVYQITYSLQPSGNYSLSNVEFSSSNESVLVVDKDGLVTPLSKGVSTVTVKDKFSGVNKSVLVTVGDKVYLPSFTFGSVTGFSNTDNGVYYSSQNSSGAVYSINFQSDLDINSTLSVSGDGVDTVLGKNKIYFYPKRTGEVTITATASYNDVNGFQTKTFSHVVTVSEKALPLYTTPLTVSETDVILRTNEEKELTLNFNDYSTGLLSAQARLFYMADSRFLSLESTQSGIKLKPEKVGNTTFYLYSVYNNSLVKTEVLVSVIQGLPTSPKILAPSGWAVNGKELNLTVVGDGVKFNSSDFTWEVSDNASVVNGKFYSEKNGSYTVTATHKTIENFTVTKTISVKYSYHTYVRKLIGHFSLFLVLAIFATIVYYRLAEMLKPNKKVLLGTTLSLGAGLLTAAISEFLQSGIFVSGRGPSLSDVGIDFLGFILGTAIYLVIYIIYRKVKAKKLSKR